MHGRLVTEENPRGADNLSTEENPCGAVVPVSSENLCGAASPTVKQFLLRLDNMGISAKIYY